MDKRKVIEAYYRGLLTIEECAQILGSNHAQVVDMIESKTSNPALVNAFPSPHEEQA